MYNAQKLPVDCLCYSIRLDLALQYFAQVSFFDFRLFCPGFPIIFFTISVYFSQDFKLFFQIANVSALIKKIIFLVRNFFLNRNFFFLDFKLFFLTANVFLSILSFFLRDLNKHLSIINVSIINQIIFFLDLKIYCLYKYFLFDKNIFFDGSSHLQYPYLVVWKYYFVLLSGFFSKD